MKVLQQRCEDEHIQIIAPWKSPFLSTLPKVKASEPLHSWVKDALRPYTKWDQMLDSISWWWRKPWGWLLRAWRFMG